MRTPVRCEDGTERPTDGLREPDFMSATFESQQDLSYVLKTFWNCLQSKFTSNKCLFSCFCSSCETPWKWLHDVQGHRGRRPRHRTRSVRNFFSEQRFFQLFTGFGLHVRPERLVIFTLPSRNFADPFQTSPTPDGIDEHCAIS